MEGIKPLPRKSISDRVWIDPVQEVTDNHVRDYCQSLGVSERLGRIMLGRNLTDESDAHGFLNPHRDQLYQPRLMKDMDVGVERIVRAIRDYEKIIIFGDYDVDGTASAAILYGYLKRLGARAQYFIPHRIHDGYGFTPVAVQKIQRWQADLVITTDQGSTEVEGAEIMRELGIDLIITDHHQFGEVLPAAMAIINPQRPDCPYPFKGLAAAGVAYKVACALDSRLQELDFFDRQGIRRTDPDYYLDLVALATVADMAPLLGENRILVKMGLEHMNENPRPGLSGLIKECRIRGPVTANAISFKLAPKINALGRIGNPRLGMQLLLSRSYSESRRLARGLMETNRERQVIERHAMENAWEQTDDFANMPGLVLVGPDWHPGVVGMLATRIASQTGKPTVVLTMREPPHITGSVRSNGNVNVLKILESCGHLLERFGGHPNAAGLMIAHENLQAFTQRFQNCLARGLEGCSDLEGGPDFEALRIEAWVEQEDLGSLFFQELERLSPFGYHNPEPLIAVRGLKVDNPNLFNDRHLRFNLQDSAGEVLEAFAWDRSHWELRNQGHYDVAFRPQSFSGFNGTRMQLRIVDLIFSE